MLIANPLYDVVFKFLMEDSRVAKSLLSALLQQEILELEFLPQEMTAELNTIPPDTTELEVRKATKRIYRMDFSAKIRTEEGPKQIIIEVQKARLAENISRFRAYLGKQYMNRDSFYWVWDSKRNYKAGIPIFSIYLLGYELDSYSKVPILSIENTVKDRFSQEKLTNKEPFVESLFHSGLIVIIPALKGRRRDELEKLLSIFDQSNQEKDFHILNVEETDFSEAYRPIIRRLQTAILSQDLREKMLAEDEYLNEIEELERSREDAIKQAQIADRKVEAATQKAEAATQKAEQAEQKAEEERRQKEAAEQKAAEERKEKEAEKQKRQEAEQKLRLMVEKCLLRQMSHEEIAELTGLEAGQIAEIAKGLNG
jgi:flagellar biosynthesis GTPase FlhF